MARPEAAQQVQRERVTELALAMGFGAPTDRQAARMIDTLAPYIPGLTIKGPADGIETPPELGLTWRQAVVGRRKDWTTDELRSLADEVDAVRASGRATTDRAALRLIVNGRKFAGEAGLAVKTLANRLAEARAIFPLVVPETR